MNLQFINPLPNLHKDLVIQKGPAIEVEIVKLMDTEEMVPVTAPVTEIDHIRHVIQDPINTLHQVPDILPGPSKTESTHHPAGQVETAGPYRPIKINTVTHGTKINIPIPIYEIKIVILVQIISSTEAEAEVHLMTLTVKVCKQQEHLQEEVLVTSHLYQREDIFQYSLPRAEVKVQGQDLFPHFRIPIEIKFFQE
jgi:hypothetical protein